MTGKAPGMRSGYGVGRTGASIGFASSGVGGGSNHPGGGGPVNGKYPGGKGGPADPGPEPDPVDVAGVEDSGAVNDTNPGGNFGAGPAPDGGPGAPSTGAVSTPNGLPPWNACQRSLMYPSFPGV